MTMFLNGGNFGFESALFKTTAQAPHFVHHVASAGEGWIEKRSNREGPAA